MNRPLVFRIALLAAAVTAGLALWGAEKSAEKSESRPAPKFSLDAKPINRTPRSA